MKYKLTSLPYLSRREHIRASVVMLIGPLCLPRFAHATDKQVIKLGQSAPVTGPQARVGLAFRDTARAVFNEANSKGGINGKNIELITLDDENRSERTELNAKLLACRGRRIAVYCSCQWWKGVALRNSTRHLQYAR
jgi:hypothetical protein